MEVVFLKFALSLCSCSLYLFICRRKLLFDFFIDFPCSVTKVFPAFYSFSPITLIALPHEKLQNKKLAS